MLKFLILLMEERREEMVEEGFRFIITNYSLHQISNVCDGNKYFFNDAFIVFCFGSWQGQQE